MQRHGHSQRYDAFFLLLRHDDGGRDFSASRGGLRGRRGDGLPGTPVRNKSTVESDRDSVGNGDKDVT
jgi:hypothetical protein